jgi:naphthalene 1,2-dioxygenase ferredoxin reductase component
MVSPGTATRIVGRVAAITRATHDIRIVRLELAPGERFEFLAGQYAALGFGQLPPRDYSMASRPDEPMLEFHIRDMGVGPSAYVAGRLAIGETVTIDGPFGDGYLRTEHEGPILVIAGGSGLAPMKSVVETALAVGMRQPIRFYFGVREEGDLYLESHFAALAARHPNLSFTPVLSSASAGTSRRTGYVAECALADIADLSGFKAYLAGPPVMVEAATRGLLVRGLRLADIHADPFYTETDKARMAARQDA